MAIGWLCCFFSCLLPPPHRPPPLPMQWNSYIDGIERLFFHPGNASNKDLLTMTTTMAYWTIIRTEGGGLGEWGEGERAGWCEQDGDTEMRAPTANDDGNTQALWGIDTYPNEGSEAPNGSGGTQLWVPFCLQTPLWPDAPPKTTYSASYSTADDAMTGASIADTTTDLTHPTRPVRSNYRTHRCRPPPRPSSPSPASPRAPRAPTSGHLPLFEWGNIAVRPVLPTDPTVTRCPPTTPLPTLYDIPPALQGSPLPRNLTTPRFRQRGMQWKCRRTVVEPRPLPLSLPTSRLQSPLPPMTISVGILSLLVLLKPLVRLRCCAQKWVIHFWCTESSFFWCPMVGVIVFKWKQVLYSRPETAHIQHQGPPMPTNLRQRPRYSSDVVAVQQQFNGCTPLKYLPKNIVVDPPDRMDDNPHILDIGSSDLQLHVDMTHYGTKKNTPLCHLLDIFMTLYDIGQETSTVDFRRWVVG
ncbi:hypothetical protein EDD18DRAFT_1100454 [Armillaria luteobubalina]|uniref:Uncharacterized protein n=1 Tax=Armillaria luteobubalina TaxID=153913 RepID=A0AA39QGM0_9AGAR|nr:hypothetical protein EDD18DRAFT_1100454 [Armillaria luteobubalina]